MKKQEIIKYLISLLNLKTPTELGNYLGVGKQGIHQWKNGKRQEDITTKIMSELIGHIESQKTPNNENLLD